MLLSRAAAARTPARERGRPAVTSSVTRLDTRSREAATAAAHSTIEFRVKHMVIQTVRGRFRDFDGAIVAGDEPSVSGSIRVASLETLNEERDAHLRSGDFFDAARYPEIGFRAGGMQFNGDD